MYSRKPLVILTLLVLLAPAYRDARSQETEKAKPNDADIRKLQQQRVEVLFMSTLSRRPHDFERDKFVAYAKRGGADEDRGKALGDILWALLNSAEFAHNH